MDYLSVEKPGTKTSECSNYTPEIKLELAYKLIFHWVLLLSLSTGLA